MNVKLKHEERTVVTEIVSEYKEIRTELDSVESKLLELEKKKNEILKHLSGIKIKETDFFKSLTEHYGVGKLDVFTLEYIIK